MLKQIGAANCLMEWTFRSGKGYGDPFNDVELDVVFTDPDGAERRVPAFWAGDDVWRVRYASPKVGTHRYRTVGSDEDNKGLHGLEGDFKVNPYEGRNPLLRHGPLRVSENQRYLAHLDGTPFFWLADTWWMGLCKRLKWPGGFHELTADRVAKGFTVIQIVAGLYPDMAAFDERGANEAGFPWDKDFVSKYVEPSGFEKWRKHILGVDDAIPKTPEWAEGKCAVPAQTIRQLTKLVATRRPAWLWCRFASR